MERKIPSQRGCRRVITHQLINNKLRKIKTQTSINNFVWHLFLIRMLFVENSFWHLYLVRFRFSIDVLCVFIDSPFRVCLCGSILSLFLSSSSCCSSSNSTQNIMMDLVRLPNRASMSLQRTSKHGKSLRHFAQIAKQAEASWEQRQYLHICCRLWSLSHKLSHATNVEGFNISISIAISHCVIIIAMRLCVMALHNSFSPDNCKLCKNLLQLAFLALTPPDVPFKHDTFPKNSTKIAKQRSWASRFAKSTLSLEQ